MLFSACSVGSMRQFHLLCARGISADQQSTIDISSVECTHERTRRTVVPFPGIAAHYQNFLFCVPFLCLFLFCRPISPAELHSLRGSASSLVSRYAYFCFSCADFSTSAISLRTSFRISLCSMVRSFGNAASIRRCCAFSF